MPPDEEVNVNALYKAARNGRRESVKMLLDRGVDVNAQGGEFGTALQVAASRYNNKDTVQMLLDRGADVNAQSGHYGTALQAAATVRDNEDTVQMLLDRGAAVNAQGGHYGTALQTAATVHNNENTVQMLLDRGADANAQGGYFGNALQAAVVFYETNKKKTVKILLDRGADVNAQGGHYGNALQAAATMHDNKDTVQMLLDRGADINAQGGHYGTALQAAATVEDNKDTVRMLLDRGADVNAQGGHYGNALQAAAKNYDDKDTVQMLLDRGADGNAQGGYYGNALQAAVLVHNNKDTVQMLLDQGADINAQGGEYGTALQAAVAKGKEEMVGFLLSLKASALIDSPARDGSYLLHASVSSGNPRILNALLVAGAAQFLDRKNSSEQTPFLLAASSANLQISEILYSLMNQPSSAIEERDIDGRTALHLAVETGNIKYIRWLLDKGAKADTPDLTDTTPFQRASELGHFQILCDLFATMPQNQSSINASRWRSISRTDKATIEMTKGPSSIKILSGKEFVQYMDDRSYSLDLRLTELSVHEKSLAEDTTEKRLFLLSDDDFCRNEPPYGLRYRWWRKTAKEVKSYEVTNRRDLNASQVWIAKVDVIPSAGTLNYARPGECLLECRLALPVLRSTDLREIPGSLSAALGLLKKDHCIVWIMVKPKSSKAKQNTEGRLLKSTTFFSTLEHAAVPNAAIDLYEPLIQQLREEWDNIYEAAERHLKSRRTEVLASRGLGKTLIEALLHDAMLWGMLSGLLEDQFVTLTMSFGVKNWTLIFEEDNPTKSHELRDRVNWFAGELRDKFRNLAVTSQELIQLEFNLTSIAEAQKSTTMNRSMKRLSWITFIFLPLMFIATLFGMNIDLLESNPKWWLFLPFAAGTTLLTCSVWIIFKRSENLESRIEGKFRWLVKQESWDEEKGGAGRTRNSWIKKVKFS